MTTNLSNERMTLAKAETAKLVATRTAKKTLEVARLQHADVIVMETDTSRYEFMVLDPAMREGVLRGGVLEANCVNVKWSGSVIKNALSDFFDHKILSCGGRALFHIVNGSFPNNFLVTSTIVRIFLQRNPAAAC